MKSFKFTAFSLAILLSTSAIAQTNFNQETADRTDRLERDIQLLQKQLANRGGSTTTEVESPSGNSSNSANIGVQLSQIQEELRRIHGQIEKNDFAIKRLQESQERMLKDVDFRFSELEKSSASSNQPQTDTAQTEQPTEQPQPVSQVKNLNVLSEKPKLDIKVEDAIPEEKQAAPAAKDPIKSFEQPRDHYNYAFRLLTQTRYDESAEYFRSFVKKFPSDPLIGNAYYWLGETHYIKRDYVGAADQFRQGFEVLPNGPKAADNLLKLAMALSALKRTDDSCTVLKQITTKFSGASSVLLKKTQDEKTRIGCS